MKKNGSVVPEILQIKGYKYRAQMLIAAVIILIILLLIISAIINGIASLFKGKDTSEVIDSATDTDSYVSQIVSSDAGDTAYVSSVTSQTTNTVSNTHVENTEYRFDADNKLIIDTDTLDGKKAVALTFDDGPGEYTQKLLNGLKERGVKATFFMCGSCVEKYPDVLPQMAADGHQIGSHTYSHSDITSLGKEERSDQISRTDNAIQNACGEISTAFRPPYGSHNAETDAEITDKTIALWSLDTLDWQSRDANAIRDVVVNKVWDGDIILFHDIYESSVDGAFMVIDELKEKGYVFVTVDELLTRYGYPIQKGTAHNSQYAVYETNSPHAAEYQAEVDERIRKAEEERAASEAAEAFYTDSSSSSAASGSDTSSVVSETTYKNEDEYEYE